MIWFVLIMVCLLGLAMGSFLNCMAWRLYHEESVWGRSKCPKCHKQLTWYDNIPVLGWLMLRGKCCYCKGGISPQYILMEAVVASLFVLVFLFNIDFDFNRLMDILWSVSFDWHWFLSLLRDWFFLSALVLIFIMDLDWYVIIDEVSLTAAGVMMLANLYLGMPWQSIVIAGAVGAGFFLLQYLVSRGAWVGGGDIRMGLLMGVALGWPNVLVGLMVAYIIGAVWGVGLILLGKKKMQWNKKLAPASDEVIAESALPFGTFLAIGAFIAYYFGTAIINWYFGFIF